MPAKRPSPQQKAIWETLAKEESHVVIQALAGTGKTTTIIGGMKHLPKGSRVAFVCFNRAIAQELQSRVPQGVIASTLHSLGFGMIRQAFGNVTVSQDKTIQLLPAILRMETKRQIAKIVSYCKGNLLDGSDYAELDAMCFMHGIELNGDRTKIYQLVQLVLEASRDRTDLIDYDDMIWMPVVLELKARKFDVLMVDESQDLNLAQQELVMRSGNRIVLVGDSHQAIYGFRGADAMSMQRMQERLGETPRGVKILPLTVTYRCPVSVVVLARRIVPGLQPRDDAPMGKVIRAKTGENPEPLPAPVVGNMVLCRVNAPLISMAYGLIKDDVKVIVQGRDIGAGLASRIKKLASPEDESTALITAVSKYREEETKRINADETRVITNESKLMVLNDTCDCIQFLCEGTARVQEVLDRIARLFQDVDKRNMKDVVLLSSVHRSKGLEAPTVHILEPGLMPHPMARLDWEMVQEKNLQYVAYTRSMETLVIRG